MHPYMAQILISDHTRESRRQAAARRPSAAHGAHRKPSTRAARRGVHWQARSA